MRAESLTEIRTSRLVLRVPGPEDASALLRFAVENRAFHTPFDPVPPDGWDSLEHWEKYANRAIRELQEDTSFKLVLVSNPGAILGMANFTSIQRGPFQACQLGYKLSRNAEGQGVMFEALSAAIPVVFGVLDLHRIMANHLPENLRSGRLLRRLGFVVEGYARDYLKINGVWRDHVLTALTRPG